MSCRFVKSKVTRLSLVDASRKALKDLEARPEPKATAAELAAAQRRIQLNEADGYWIEVKNELNAGEHRDIFDRMVKKIELGEKAELDPKQVGLAKMVEYILNWNLTNEDSQLEVITARDGDVDLEKLEASLKHLDIYTFNEIAEAVNAHEAVLEAQRTDLKNEVAGLPASVAI